MGCRIFGIHDSERPRGLGFGWVGVWVGGWGAGWAVLRGGWAQFWDQRQ